MHEGVETLEHYGYLQRLIQLLSFFAFMPSKFMHVSLVVVAFKVSFISTAHFYLTLVFVLATLPHFWHSRAFNSIGCCARDLWKFKSSSNASERHTKTSKYSKTLLGGNFIFIEVFLDGLGDIQLRNSFTLQWSLNEVILYLDICCYSKGWIRTLRDTLKHCAPLFPALLINKVSPKYMCCFALMVTLGNNPWSLVPVMHHVGVP